MPEPITLAVLTTAALTQGITFMYNQAAELLKRRRERKAAAAKGVETPAAVVPTAKDDESVLAGQLRPLPIDEQVVDERAEMLEALTGQLSSYVNGIRGVDPADTDLLTKAEALRGLLELAFRQRITFRGEEREASGAVVDVSAVAERVDGELITADVRTVGPGGHVRSTTKIGTIGPEATVTGFRADSVGG